MKLLIKDVGRSKKSSTIEVADDCEREWVAAAIYDEVCRMKALMSRDVDCIWDPETRTGAVYAGGRPVGTVEVES